MQSPPDQPGRHSAQYLPLMKKSSLGPHVPLLQRLQFSNTLQPERSRARRKIAVKQESGRRARRIQTTQTNHDQSFKRAVIVRQSWEHFALTYISLTLALVNSLSSSFTYMLLPPKIETGKTS